MAAQGGARTDIVATANAAPPTAPAGSTNATMRLAATWTLIATARAHRLDAMDDLTRVFTALPELGEDDSVALLPPAAAKAAGPTTSSARSAPARRPGDEAATTALLPDVYSRG